MKMTMGAPALLAAAMIAAAAPAQDTANPLYAAAVADEAFIQLTAKLGDDRGYCVDFPGFPASGIVSAYREATWPIGMHTCKTRIEHANVATIDQLFVASALRDGGQLRFSRLKVCAEVVTFGGVKAPGHVQETGIRTDAQLVANPCSGKPEQQFVLDAVGRIKPVLDPGKCLTVGKEAFEAGDRTPGHPWHRRDLQLRRCSGADRLLQTWRIAPAA